MALDLPLWKTKKGKILTSNITIATPTFLDLWPRNKHLNPLSANPTKCSNIHTNSSTVAKELFEYVCPFCGVKATPFPSNSVLPSVTSFIPIDEPNENKKHLNFTQVIPTIPNIRSLRVRSIHYLTVVTRGYCWEHIIWAPNILPVRK